MKAQEVKKLISVKSVNILITLETPIPMEIVLHEPYVHDSPYAGVSVCGGTAFGKLLITKLTPKNKEHPVFYGFIFEGFDLGENNLAEKRPIKGTISYDFGYDIHHFQYEYKTTSGQALV